MKFVLPDGCVAVTYEGTALAVAADGTIEAEPTAAETLAAHGVVPAQATPEDRAPERSIPPAEKAGGARR